MGQINRLRITAGMTISEHVSLMTTEFSALLETMAVWTLKKWKNE